MIWFSKRKKLADMFEKWAKENNVLNCPTSVITWLLMNNCLNENKCYELLKEKETPLISKEKEN